MSACHSPPGPNHLHEAVDTSHESQAPPDPIPRYRAHRSGRAIHAISTDRAVLGCWITILIRGNRNATSSQPGRCLAWCFATSRGGATTAPYHRPAQYNHLRLADGESANVDVEVRDVGLGRDNGCVITPKACGEFDRIPAIANMTRVAYPSAPV